jgi:hypothetical protein
VHGAGVGGGGVGSGGVGGGGAGGGGVGAGGGGVGAGGAGAGGAGVGGGAAAADWVIVRRSPATTTATVRAAPEFAAIVSCTVPDPDPEVGVTVANGLSLAAVQEQALWVETEMLTGPPAAVTV